MITTLSIAVLAVTALGVSAQSDLSPAASVVGFPGPRPTGAESEVAGTAPAATFKFSYYPQPAWMENYWSGFIPPTCELLEAHMLRGHGARHSSSNETVSTLGAKIANATASGKLNATGDLAFLNTWKYGLGTENLTSYEREQLFDLGVFWRVKWGHLLDNVPNGTLPVFRTTSPDRMVMSALNFAAGVALIQGHSHQVNQTVDVHTGIAGNNTSSPASCKNLRIFLSYPSVIDNDVWPAVWLANATARINSLVTGINFTTADVGNMQSLCAYESVAVGHSDFCGLFTEAEWEGFEYSSDLTHWYGFAWGAPAAAAAMGAGWVQELVARLTDTTVTISPSTIVNNNTFFTFVSKNHTVFQNSLWNGTSQSLVGYVFVALNSTSFTKTGPLPVDHIPAGKRSFVASETTPFSTALVAQVVNCTDASGSATPYIRWLLNDASVSLDNIPGCGADAYGRCPLDAFVAAMKVRAGEINYDVGFSNVTANDIFSAD
ncbi:phosphoglycerate mutase-like protein [Calocera viscosa TUFC12733]|uniref:Phosphoglycerate mutase-like protein n=1 Tax=Calocera viscosa (strain TUFC12733) TaxID=1330018 RepID=A0A167RE90_CALVF|nr:phosphoglycerate mutase-like protein [Calocera viscosa TUFC12733]